VIAAPSAGYTNAVENNSTLEIRGKVEVDWDSNGSYADESVYFLSAKGDEEIQGELGHAVMGTLDITLSNITERFSPENSDSAIVSYLKLSLQPIKFSIGIKVSGSYEYLQRFTGYVDEIVANEKDGTVLFKCKDGAVKLQRNYPQMGIYQNYRTDELVDYIGNEGGILDANMILETGKHKVGTAVFDGGICIWDLMAELAEAEAGRVFFDNNGKLNFWNRYHLITPGHEWDLGDSFEILNRDGGYSEKYFKNKIKIDARPKVTMAEQVIWDMGQTNKAVSAGLNKAIVIPPNSTETIQTDFRDPITSITTPVAATDYEANTVIDGSGTSINANLSISKTDYAQSSVLVLTSNYNGIMYITKLQLRGTPVKIVKEIEVENTDDVSLVTVGEKLLSIGNDFIDAEAYVIELAIKLLAKWKKMLNPYTLSINCVPMLQAGDVVSFQATKDRDCTYATHFILGKSKLDGSDGLAGSDEVTNGKYRFGTILKLSYDVGIDIFNNSLTLLDVQEVSDL